MVALDFSYKLTSQHQNRGFPMTDESYIQVNAETGSTAFVGPDAVDLFRVRMLRSALIMHKKCRMIPTRGMTITKMFAATTQITGKKYKRGEHDKAIADLDIFLNNLESAMPIVKD